MILEKITDENRDIFQRLDNTKTHYSNKFFQQSRKKTEVYLKAISKYPHSFHFLPSPKANNEEVKKNYYFIKILTKQNDQDKKKKIEKEIDSSKENREKSPDSDGELDEKKVLYCQIHRVSNKNMQIEISKKEKYSFNFFFFIYISNQFFSNRNFQIAAMDLKTIKIHYLLLKEDFFYKFLRQIDYKYPELIKYLSFKDEKLMLEIEKVYNLN